jgi:murein DD-endopeptidase MepM/ murein hydrolase activator NlpD
MKKIILILTVATLAGCATVPPSSGPMTMPVAVSHVSSGIRHRVEAGQTLWQISKIYNVDIDDIIRVNRISESTPIEIGQVLLIPGGSKTQNISPRPTEPVQSAGDDFIWPLKGRVIAGFGSTYRNLINRGINIQTSSGANVLASRSGRVVFYSSSLGNFGKTVIIDHGDGLRSVYSRISDCFVQAGENVSRGALIGRAGSSTRDKNSYLHFEIRKGSLPQNPLFYLP